MLDVLLRKSIVRRWAARGGAPASLSFGLLVPRPEAETTCVIPETRYAKTADGVHVAYQILGDGPIDLILVHSWTSHVELFWELPSFDRMMRGLSAFARVIHFDKRGTGLSDRLSHVPTLEARMDDIRAVLDDVGTERAAIFGTNDGAALAALFAGTYPDRTLAMILFGGRIRIAWAPDYPWGMREERFSEELQRLWQIWGAAEHDAELTQLVFGSTWAERLGKDLAFGPWLAKILRYAAAPGDEAIFDRVWFETDARSALPLIQVPTAILCKDGWERTSIENAEWAARQIAGAQLVKLPGDEPAPWLGDVAGPAKAIERFLATIRDEETQFDRVLATVLFTDIVGSTQRAAELGDRGWKQLVEDHHRRVRALIARYRGREVDTAGDGFFAVFDGPARAIRCARAIVEDVRSLGLEIRSGLHTGEVETVDDKVGGIAVNIGARVAAIATSGEVLVSSTVKDLVAGSGLQFEDRGSHQLKGVPGDWRLFAVTGG